MEKKKYQHTEEDARNTKENPAYPQQEDAALKTVAQFFADELLSYLGIEGKVKAIMPAELIHLEVKKLYPDMNFFMEDGTCKHLEFQSSDGGVEDLKRFRAYEAVTSYQDKVEVTTYVLYSGKVKNPVTEFTEGINTYRVIPVILRERDADSLIEGLVEKLKAGEPLTKEELVPLTLILLMGGEMEYRERVRMSFWIMEHAAEVPREEIQKMETVVYAMADKYMEVTELGDLIQDLGTTKIGRKLLDQGRKEGMKENQIRTARNLLNLLDAEEIAAAVELPLEAVLELKKQN